jgi:GT2 family glycosyltransferase
MEEMVAELAAKTCDAVGCIVYLPGGKIQSYGGRWRRWLARSVSIGHGAPLSADFDAEHVAYTQNYLNGSSMMVSRAFWEAVGPMREDYFLYCEEIEWCLRAKAMGVKLGLARRARVLHYTGTTTGAYDEPRRRPKLPVYLVFRNALLLVRDYTPYALPVAAVALSLQILLRYGRHGAWRQVGYGLSGCVAGLMNERGAPKWVNSGAS